jgi:hypothetical protein
LREFIGIISMTPPSVPPLAKGRKYNLPFMKGEKERGGRLRTYNSNILILFNMYDEENCRV